MRNFIRLISRFHLFLLFLVFETLSVYLYISSNTAREYVVLSSANTISGYFFENVNVLTKYFSLREKNEMLAQENLKYKNSFESAFRSNVVVRQDIKDDKYQQQYFYILSEVINNSTNKQYNYLTLNHGRKAGIKPGMAVISDMGVVGVVRYTSDHYSSVISVLNRKLGVSAKIKRTNFSGSISWNGEDYQTVSLREIPSHVELSIGDTIVTSGYSVIFPEGVLIGTISAFKQEDAGNFFDISVRLSNNFRAISHVYVVGNLLKEEQIELETLSQDD
jgi:rod shape-determining protein MreC